MAKEGMQWFRINSDFEEHPKTQALIDRLGDPSASVYLTRLWCWVARFYPRGTITVSPGAIERALRWQNENGLLVSSLTACGFLDECKNGLAVHGWRERNGAVFSKFQSDRDKRKPSKNPTETRTGSEGVPKGLPEGSARNPSAYVQTNTDVQTEKKEPSAPLTQGTFLEAPKVEPPPEKPKRQPRAKADKPAKEVDHALTPDREAWLAKYRAVMSSPLVDFSRDQVFQYAAMRAKYGQAVLLKALDGVPLMTAFDRARMTVPYALSDEALDKMTRPPAKSDAKRPDPMERPPVPMVVFKPEPPPDLSPEATAKRRADAAEARRLAFASGVA